MHGNLYSKIWQGHSKQSEILGPLYLLVIGLPSAVWNCISRYIKVDYYSFYNMETE